MVWKPLSTAFHDMQFRRKFFCEDSLLSVLDSLIHSGSRLTSQPTIIRKIGKRIVYIKELFGRKQGGICYTPYIYI